MFERYTEKARRTIFFARFEASQFGSSHIETEHLLLGLLREDRALTRRLLRCDVSLESIRKQIETHTEVRKRIPTSVDLPLSGECKRALEYAAEEAERASHKFIETHHLLAGLLREDKSRAAEILRERGVTLSMVREYLSQAESEKMILARPKQLSLLGEVSLDLTQEAVDGHLDPLIGRENEMQQLLETLCRRTKNHPVLVGEEGVGKGTLVNGLAQRIAHGNAPSALSGKRILTLYVSALRAGSERFDERLRAVLRELSEASPVILFVEELFVPASGEASLDAANIMRPALTRGEIQCIAAASPADYGRALEREPWLGRRFSSVSVFPPDEANAVKILLGVKDRYEKFHGVAYTDEALEYAVYHSSRFIPSGCLPGKAIDVIDEAGAGAKLRQQRLPEEVIEGEKRLAFVTERMEQHTADNQPEKARFYSEQLEKERENLKLLKEKYPIGETGMVTRQEIEEVVARRAGVPVSAIRQEHP